MKNSHLFTASKRNEVNILVTLHASEARNEFVKIFMAQRNEKEIDAERLFTNKHANTNGSLCEKFAKFKSVK